jgi:hypothetical protein
MPIKTITMKYKSIILAPAVLLFLMSSQVLHAQEVLEPSTKVPVVILQAFNAEYPNAKNVEWYKRKKQAHEAELVIDNVSISILFDKKGSIINRKKEISYSEYPEEVKTALKSEYIDKGYKPLSYMKRVEGETILFETLLAKGRHLIVIKYEPNGKFVSNVSLNKWQPVEIISIN